MFGITSFKMDEDRPLTFMSLLVNLSSYLRSGASWQVQLQELFDRVRLVIVPNSRLLGRDLSLLLSKCSDLMAVTPVNAPSEN